MTMYMPLEDRFWNKVRKSDNCWEWTAGKNRGYGAFFVNGKNVGAHKFSWEIHFGEIPKGMYVCHRCDNSLCVRPDHLFLGTQLDNIQDSVMKGRFWPSNEKLTMNDARNIKKLHSSRRFTQEQLGTMFEVSRTTIYRIIHNISYRGIQCQE